MAWPTHIVAAAGNVEDGKGNILLVKTLNRGWVCPGGQIEIGESLEEGLLREIYEESGVTARVKALVAIYSNVGQHVHYDGVTHVPTKVMFDFLCEYVGGDLRPSEETSEVLWVPKHKALDYITAPAQVFAYNKLLEFSGKVTYSSYVTKPQFRVISDRLV